MFMTMQLLPVILAAYIVLMFWPKPILRKKWYALGWLTVAAHLLMVWIACVFGLGGGFTWLPDTLSLLPLIALVFACYPCGCGVCGILEDAGVVSVKTQEPAEKTE